MSTGSDFGTYTKQIKLRCTGMIWSYAVKEEDYYWFPNTGETGVGMTALIPEDYVSGGTLKMMITAHDDSGVRKMRRYTGCASSLSVKSISWTEAPTNWDLTTTQTYSIDLSANTYCKAGGVVCVQLTRFGDDGGDVGGRVELNWAWFEYTAAKMF